MALQDPPFNSPRIMKVLEPSTGQYEVIVRMDPAMASKFPEKPFGTSIADIGLAQKDSGKFEGYTLVSIERADKGAKDHFWTFQKLSGPEWTTKSQSKDNLTPQKYRGQTITVKTDQEVGLGTTQDELSGNLVSSIVTQVPNTGKAIKTNITESIDGGAGPLVGEEYGDIVSKTVSETLVSDGAVADTGIDVTESIVDSIGNGKSIKRTKRAKGGWPDPVNVEVSREGADMPPPRYKKDLTRTKTSRKVSTSSIPSNPSLSGNEVAKIYVKETPDRAEETTVVQSFTLNTSSIDQAVEKKPFVSILSTMTPGTSPVIPSTGNGSSRLVYEAPDGSKIYENTSEIATARVGFKGVETTAQQWGALISTTNYTTSSSAPSGGSVNQVYNDGAVQVYEATQTTPSVAGSSRDVDPQQWGSITWNGAYSTGSSGIRSRQVWSNGSTQVYLNETPTLSISGSSRDVDPQQWGSIIWNGSYSSGSSGDRSRKVTSIGGNSVYLNETATLNISGSSKDIDPQQWGYITWNGNYSNSPSGKRSRKVGGVGSNQVYLNEDPTLSISGGTKDVEPQQWGSITWAGTYSGVSSGDRSRKVTSVGDQSVYLNETPTLNIESGSFVSEKETNPLYTMTDTSSYSSAPVAAGKNSRSRMVFAQNGKRVFENIETDVSPQAARTYGTVVRFSVPAVLNGIKVTSFSRRDGQTEAHYYADISEGYDGYFPAEVVERFELTPSTPKGAGKVFHPAPVSFSTPFGSLSIGATLHAAMSIQTSVGSDDPVYSPGSYHVIIPSTDPPSLKGVGRILVDYSAAPYKNGFITRSIYVTIK